MQTNLLFSKTHRYAFFVMWVVGTMTCCGCTWFNDQSGFETKLEAETHVEKPPSDVTDSQKVRWDGGGVVIGETDSLAYSPDTFLKATARLIDEQRMAIVLGMVKTYPDIALQTLQETSPDTDHQMAFQMIGTFLDETWGNGQEWQKYSQDLQSLPKRSSEELDIRMRFWRYLKNNQPEQALKLKITKTLHREHGVMLRAEFYRLESIAGMMSGNQQASIGNLETAVELVAQPSPWFACKLQLLLGEFYRHADRTQEWKATWTDAVIANSRIARIHDKVDPQFWNRASFLRPAGLPWPNEVIDNLKSVLKQMDVAETGRSLRLTAADSVIWFAIGIEHLNRSEGQNALLAFKKSEASESAPASIKALKLYQARSLVSTGQPGAASAILFRMVSENEGSQLADRAKAILATMKLQNGSVTQGLNLIQSAMPSIESWPRGEQRRTRADYGLGLLMRGRESEGLKQLDLAQAQFEEAGEFDQARQCLWNRAKYLEKTEQTDKYREAALQLTELESRLH